MREVRLRQPMNRSVAALAMVALLLACKSSEPDTLDPSGAGTTSTSSSSGSMPSGESGDSSDTTTQGSDDGPGPGGNDCPQLSCLPCGNGLGCAADGEPIGSTCCAEGDSLVHLASGDGWNGAESVDIETDGHWAFLCGGFGGTIMDVRVPDAPVHVATAGYRCQHAALGPELEDGARVFYVAHHGDTFVPMPSLQTYHISSKNELTEVDAIEDPDVLFEGVLVHEGVLYVAAHSGGVRVYTTDEKGSPTFVGAVDGFDNAIKLAAKQSTLYVADGVGGVRVSSLADPLAPQHVTTMETIGIARDVDVDGDRLYVALGSNGVAVYDIEEPQAPLHVGTISTGGSVQGVSAEGDVVAVAAWSHVAAYDATTFQLLATERVLPTPEFEQDLGIVMIDNLIHVAEWNGLHTVEYRPGYVAPDLWVQEELYNFDADVSDEKVVVVRNRGYLDLDVDSIDPGVHSAFSVDASELMVPPGEGRAFEVAYETFPFEVSALLSLFSNDPDSTQSPFVVPVVALKADELIDIGDPLTDEFGFLDPNGVGQVSGLEGHVVVLAYFALF